MVNSFSKEIYAYALENALLHEKAIESAVLPKLFQHGLKKEEIKEVMPEIYKVISKVNSMSKEEIDIEFEENKKYLKEKRVEEEGLKELPNPSGKMVFRLAPFPSGSLHIGHTKTYLLNALYAEKYKGKILFVMDDTIGSDEKLPSKEAYDLISEAFDYLNVKYKKPIIYKSDRLKIYYKYAEKLIKKEKAYVCNCSQKELRENRISQKECGCRIYPSEVQMKRWKEMFKAKPGEFILRIKTSMTYPDPAFRDRVIFRISDRVHPRVGKKYRVWPLLDFSWAIDDHLLGITHIIRGKELMIEGKMEKYIWDIFGWEAVEMIYVGLMKLEGVVGKISKSKAQKEVMSGKYSGWDDPRTWSVQSLRRRGILADSIREFIEEIGLNQKDIIVPIDGLYAINRRKIDANADRYFFVEKPVKIKIKEGFSSQEISIPIHPEKKEKKIIQLDKNIFVSDKDFKKFEGKNVRLMHLHNIKLKKESKIEKENLDVQKIQWVSKHVKVKIMMPNGKYIRGFAEENIKKLKEGEIIQFERVGFCKFDNFNKKENMYEFWFSHD